MKHGRQLFSPCQNSWSGRGRWQNLVLSTKVARISADTFRGELKRLHENGDWYLNYATLYLEVLYIYKDRQKTDLYGQFPLRDITIQFPKDNQTPHCFQLSSFDPPFLLTLCAMDGIEELPKLVNKLQQSNLMSGWWKLIGVSKLFNVSSRTTKKRRVVTQVIPLKRSRVLPTVWFWNYCTSDILSNRERIESCKIKNQQEAAQAQDESLRGWKCQCPHGKWQNRIPNSAQKELLENGLQLSDDEKGTTKDVIVLNLAELVKKSWVVLTGKKFVDANGMAKSGIGKLFE